MKGKYMEKGKRKIEEKERETYGKRKGKIARRNIKKQQIYINGMLTPLAEGDGETKWESFYKNPKSVRRETTKALENFKTPRISDASLSKIHGAEMEKTLSLKQTYSWVSL